MLKLSGQIKGYFPMFFRSADSMCLQWDLNFIEQMHTHFINNPEG